MSTYPPRDQIDLPIVDDPSQDQEYYVGWLAQHHRAWLTIGALGLLNLLQLIVILMMVAKYRPILTYVTLEGGHIVTWNDHGVPTIDGREYVPARLRYVVSTFIQNRYELDYQNIQRLNTALRLMSPEAAEAEVQKIKDLNIDANVVVPRLKTKLVIDYSNWHVVSQGRGFFEVEVSGELHINDSYRYTDPNHPFVKPVTIKLTLQTVPATDTNPLGYVVVSTGRDLL